MRRMPKDSAAQVDAWQAGFDAQGVVLAYFAVQLLSGDVMSAEIASVRGAFAGPNAPGFLTRDLSELLPLRRLTVQQERLRILPLTADFEGPEVLVP